MAWGPHKIALAAIQRRWEKHGFEIADPSEGSSRQSVIVPTSSSTHGTSKEVDNLNVCGCRSSYGLLKRTYRTLTEAKAASRRSHPAQLEPYECPVFVNSWHLRTALAAKKRPLSA